MKRALVEFIGESHHRDNFLAHLKELRIKKKSDELLIFKENFHESFI